MTVLKKMILELHENFEEEIEGIEKYYSMAHTAEMAGYTAFAQYLYEMAKDEYSHALFIFESGKKQGIDISPECWRKLEEYKAILHL